MLAGMLESILMTLRGIARCGCIMIDGVPDLILNPVFLIHPELTI
jgi:hypothetical protein